MYVLQPASPLFFIGGGVFGGGFESLTLRGLPSVSEYMVCCTISPSEADLVTCGMLRPFESMKSHITPGTSMLRRALDDPLDLIL